MKHLSLIALAALAAFSPADLLRAEPLKKAEVTQIINQVGILQPEQGERPAAVNDVVEGKLGVRTGQKSRAELLFSDETLTRLGANTIFNFEDGTRNMDLSQGTILLQVPKNAGGATIKTAAVTAAVTGTTILFEHTPAPVVPEYLKLSEEQRHRKPHGYVKAMVLEGHLKVWLKGKLGESIIIGPGQMLIMADDATEIPEVVDFDIETVVHTSRLIDRSVWLERKRKLNLELITQEIYEQRKRKHTGDLIETNLVINGRGTKVVMTDDQSRQHLKDSLGLPNAVVQSSPTSTPSQPTPIGTPNPTATPSPSVTPDPSPNPTPDPSPDPTPDPSPDPTPDPSPDPTPDPTPVPENDLASFTFQGATDTINDNTPANYDPNLPGNVSTVSSLPDYNVGGTTVYPTDGDTFGVISNGGNAPDGTPYTATQGTTEFNVTPGFAAAAVQQTKTFVEMDYRVLTNELGGDSNTNDHVRFTITGLNGMQVSYVVTVAQLLDANGNPTPIARNNVGGYLSGTDWLTLKLELTPFLNAGQTSFSIAVEDYESSDGDTVVAIDRYNLNGDTSVPANSNLIGSFTALFPDGVTFGEGAGEYRAPSVEGVENINGTGPGSDGGSFEADTTTGDLVVNAPILADTGVNNPGGSDPIYGGQGGSVKLKSEQAAVVVNSTVQVAADDTAGRRVSASGGSIDIQSDQSGGDGVVINNTGELLSLLNASSPGPGGKITIRAGDSNVLINGGKVIATRGVVDVRAPGDGRQITVTNAEIRGDVVKIGALGSNGQLIVGGGTISADTTLKLYGNSSNGSVTFVADTQLNGQSAKIISANTVTVQNGVHVQVGGPAATVYTNHPNYTGSGGNNSTTGNFTGSGASTAPTPPPF